MIDYVLTVAVSVAAGVAAITSAMPPFSLIAKPWGLLGVVFIVVINLRGAREAGPFSAIPTYLAIGALGLIVVIGFRSDRWAGRRPPVGAAQPARDPT